MKFKRKAVPKKIRLFVLNSGNKRCKYCYTKDNIEVDHKIPPSLGGDNSLKNLQRLCRECNYLKGEKIHIPRPYESAWSNSNNYNLTLAGLYVRSFENVCSDELKYLYERLTLVNKSIHTDNNGG